MGAAIPRLHTPSVTNGNYSVTVTNSGGQVSNGIQYTVLTAKLIPIVFTVNNASPTQVGDYIFLTGNTVELGNWATTWQGAVGSDADPELSELVHRCGSARRANHPVQVHQDRGKWRGNVGSGQ